MRLNENTEGFPRTSQAVLYSVTAFFVALLFAAYTDHIWEDYLITFKSSKNLAMGNGLVYHVGDRLHTFTSPLGVLVPAFFSWITGNSSDVLVIWLFRIFSAAFLAGGVFFLARILQYLSVGRFFGICGLLLLLTNVKLVDFTINGMETGMLIFFTALTTYRLLKPLDRSNFVLLAVGVAGLVWSRPDGFIYAAAVGVGCLVFRVGALEGFTFRKPISSARYLILSVLLGVVLYLPWLLWAWWYYGTPIPNTVTAKGLYHHGSMFYLKSVVKLALCPFILLARGYSLNETFSVTYWTFGGWPMAMIWISRIISFVAAFHWIFPVAKKEGRALSLAALGAHVYLSFFAGLYPWYIPPATFLTILSLMCLFRDVCESRRGEGLLPKLSMGIPALGVVMSIGLLAASAYQLRLQQELIEVGNRKMIGHWLEENSSEGDSVFMECLGYIGYYSQLKTLDHPGLSSREMIEARRKVIDELPKDRYWKQFWDDPRKNISLLTSKLPHDDLWSDLLEDLEPTWLILRPREEERLLRENAPFFTSRYELKKSFDARDEVARIKFLPGRGYLEFDAIFSVYRKIDR